MYSTVGGVMKVKFIAKICLANYLLWNASFMELVELPECYNKSVRLHFMSTLDLKHLSVICI